MADCAEVKLCPGVPVTYGDGLKGTYVAPTHGDKHRVEPDSAPGTMLRVPSSELAPDEEGCREGGATTIIVHKILDLFASDLPEGAHAFNAPAITDALIFGVDAPSVEDEDRPEQPVYDYVERALNEMVAEGVVKEVQTLGLTVFALSLGFMEGFEAANRRGPRREGGIEVIDGGDPGLHIGVPIEDARVLAEFFTLMDKAADGETADVAMERVRATSEAIDVVFERLRGFIAQAEEHEQGEAKV